MDIVVASTPVLALEFKIRLPPGRRDAYLNPLLGEGIIPAGLQLLTCACFLP
jgi:hypothetical protein